MFGRYRGMYSILTVSSTVGGRGVFARDRGMSVLF